MSTDTDVLVVGAGPTGLTVALQAALLGARVRVIESLSERREWSPALAIHPRTMETLRGLGVDEAVLARGLSQVELEVHVGTTTVKGTLGQLHLPETRFPFIVFVPQPAVEMVLAEALADLGVDGEWGTELVRLDDAGDHVASWVTGSSGPDQVITARYVAGCDGAASTVRTDLGIEFRGRSYRQSIVVADVDTPQGLKSGAAHAFVTVAGILFFFPLRDERMRLIAPGRGDDPARYIAGLVRDHTAGQFDLGSIKWAREVAPDHRLASSYRRGRVFLAGDAAHVHSPAGAQGMNTGIQDGVNLGWKLALAIRGAPDRLLDTYGTERRPVAKHVVAKTGLAFLLEVSDLAPLRWGIWSTAIGSSSLNISLLGESGLWFELDSDHHDSGKDPSELLPGHIALGESVGLRIDWALVEELGHELESGLGVVRSGLHLSSPRQPASGGPWSGPRSCATTSASSW